MAYQLELTNEARLDIQETWLWYEGQKTGLGEDFLLSLEATLHHIERNPLLFQEVYINVRVALLRRFPYKVIYTLKENTVGILGVLHARRDPTSWMTRI